MREQFIFVSCGSPRDTNNRETKRLAQSHSVVQALQQKRKREQASGHNFRHMSLRPDIDRYTCLNERNEKGLTTSVPVHLVTLNPLDMLARESPGLKEFYNSYKVNQNEDFIFSVSDELVLQNYLWLVRTERDDPALLSAFMLTFALARRRSNTSVGYIEYQNQTLNSIRKRMRSLKAATSEATLGAILLLAGADARLRLPRQVQLHMGAIQQLLDICQRKGIILSDGIKRAIFWQDLNVSVLTGSCRIVDHTTFPELQWRRDPSYLNLFALPPGFKNESNLFGDAFTELLEDISALQCIRDSTYFGREDVISMADIDNQQASIQSRLVSLPNGSSISQCCHLAAYLCSAMLRCKIWRASTTPSHLSFQLLCKLNDSNSDVLWNSRPDLLAWILYIGGSFAPIGRIRSNYTILLKMNREARFKGLDTSWSQLLKMLKRFIWSDKAFMSQVKSFWEESYF